MILIWFVLAAMTLVTAVLLALPLFNTRKFKNEAQFALEVYRDQLQELNRDTLAGLIAPDQAKQAQVEIERRILALTEGPQWRPARLPSHGMLVVAAVVLPLLGFGLYLLVGRPDLPGQPFASSAQATALPPAIVALQDAVAAKPNDSAAWVALANAYADADLARDAATAFGKAVALGATSADTLAAYGRALLVANDGEMSEPARAAFRRALAAEPSHPMARFFLALGRAQDGDLEGALSDWMALEADSPADAPWRATLEEHIARASQRLGRAGPDTGIAGPSAAGPSAAGPSADDIAAAEAMSPEERQEFVNDMVGRLAERLAAEPDDLDGWLRLGRAYQVLGRGEDARNAFAKAAALAPARLDIQLDYADAIIAGRTDLDRYLPPEFIETVARIRTLDPENPLGLYYGGLVARLAGNRAEAQRLWQKVLDRLPADSPQRTMLQREFDSLLPAAN
ncbi:cytochrome c-type biogenesis protein CcmH [Dongia mobilis]|uniref:Cytochrome c-type biogenesis protein CcmH n=1 Tax=Dongia mobilis TaxID=578943 RepID=A0A4R6WPV9_9PROT|nr:c-type cytochrome biogenesis protein CcmI [Dongia mobilis]TDQ83145.1 cytochrome c-type biogenesis protein CcmH [Dongia mobilis]